MNDDSMDCWEQKQGSASKSRIEADAAQIADITRAFGLLPEQVAELPASERRAMHKHAKQILRAGEHARPTNWKE